MYSSNNNHFYIIYYQREDSLSQPIVTYSLSSSTQHQILLKMFGEHLWVRDLPG